MAIVSLTDSQSDQFALHIDELRATAIADGADPKPGESSASLANTGLSLFEERAGGHKKTGIDISNEKDNILSNSEKTSLASQINKLTESVEGSNGVAVDVANEILELIAENVIPYDSHWGKRDVNAEQLPRV